MRRAISILLLTIYLCNATECNQLLKIPVFVMHVQEHQQEHRYGSLWGFIVEHYFSGNVRDADWQRDMELPFKSHEYLTNANPVPPPPTEPQLALVVHRQVVVMYPVYTNRFHPLIYHPDIFQPPKTMC
ncbi:hypothetical protein F0L74_11575 [Chitinophaga agrisoli]|uniref:Uncharacterized protein n=1 Tax=Chitinophaga agrisoli TaxID=2607653 RepID=A0A5B2VX11_9BACT|nr:hypothetical protein [Chitinophaga agrisoli]KAA2243148.1 hypothetical protein F0L74_11575 [Chitinophaga agrisoli]